MDGLPSRRYTVGSFFGAVHVVASRAMPCNRSLGEYIAIANLLGKLIARLFEHLNATSNFPIPMISTSMALIVCCASNLAYIVSPLARATIGFSLIDGKKKKRRFINERKSNLPVLKSVNAGRILDWEPGNCAEDETFGHLEAMHTGLFRNSQEVAIASGENRIRKLNILSVSLTLKLQEKRDDHVNPMKGKPFCDHCRELAQKLSRQHAYQLIDIAAEA